MAVCDQGQAAIAYPQRFAGSERSAGSPGNRRPPAAGLADAFGATYSRYADDIVLSGGPASVYADGAPKLDPELVRIVKSDDVRGGWMVDHLARSVRRHR